MLIPLEKDGPGGIVGGIYLKFECFVRVGVNQNQLCGNQSDEFFECFSALVCPFEYFVFFEAAP